jgi:hypothetical protein
MKGIGYFQNLRIFLEFFGRKFLGEIFLEDFFGRIFWGEFFFYVGIDLFRQDFGWFLSIFCLNGEGRRKKFRSLEV